MLLPFVYHHPSLPPLSLTNNSFFSPFPCDKRLLHCTPHKPSSKFLVLSSLSVPSTELVPKSAIQRIAEKLRSLGFTEDTKPETGPEATKDSAGEIFVPLPNQLPKYRVGHTLDPSWSTPQNPVPEPGTGSAISRFHELRNEAKKEKEAWKREKGGEERLPTLAELTLPKMERRRLSRMGMQMKKKLKVGKAGITEGIVNGIHERWRHSEVVKIVCEDLCKMNMNRTHEFLERKTGGLVVWRAGSKIVLYRGANYKYPYFTTERGSTNDASLDSLPELHTSNDGHDKIESCSSSLDAERSGVPSPTSQSNKAALIQGVGSPNRVRFQLPGERELAEEADRLLEGLGPRFTDWWGYEPLPVDADLLPPVVTGFRRPFRLLPYGVSPKLTNDEMTILRRLGRPLPCHFALGRNKNLQGLAAAILKLWEKCEIAKIAVKRGVQNTNSEMMAEELKQLTGGTLLSRDKEFIVLYRGKDFLPPAVSSAIEERRKIFFNRDKQFPENIQSIKTTEEIKLGTIESASEDELDGKGEKTALLSEKKRLSLKEAAVKRTSTKLSIALEKKDKAEKLLVELEKAEIPQQPEVDVEGITEEERYMLRRVGLRMKPFLLLGRRGVFDGTIENMHLHWKYRELVKIICKERSFESVQQVAQTLEAESGGILVAIERVSKGYAIIVYRGKNYKRPSSLRPQTLLTKRGAMKRSLEAQRRESLKLHVLELSKKINELKCQLAKDEESSAKDKESSGLQSKESLEHMQPPEYVASDAEHKFSGCSNFGFSASHCENKEARDSNGDESTSTTLCNNKDASLNIVDDPHLARLINFSTSDASKAHVSVVEAAFESISDVHDANVSAGTSNENRAGDSASCPDTVMAEGSCSSTDNYEHNEATDSVVEESVETQSVPSASVVVDNTSYETSSRPVYLSNRERLLLRKQALKMKKRPVLSVGKSNNVNGVAKAIKAHFEKHPLAIVNVKGRAKGTPVQEIVFKLEQATGAVLVSQEPSKIILYRGWGAGIEIWNTRKNNIEPGIQNPVSPELVEAIRLECGLHCNKQESKNS